jgi:diguanylate cyclase (GGDEF)-like protein
MHFRSLESRIVTLFLVLLVTVQLTGLIAINIGILGNARDAIHDQLVINQRVFRQLLQQKRQKLTEGARLLASDYAFRQAITTGTADDQKTINSVLQNHGDRINAALTMFLGIDHKVRATTVSIPPSVEDMVTQLLIPAEQVDSASGIAIVDHMPYQIVVVPVKAPILYGWVVMAFPINKAMADEMRALSGLEVAILTREKTGTWQVNASTLTRADSQSMRLQLQSVPIAEDKAVKLRMSDSEFSAEFGALGKNGGQTTGVLLLRSVSEALAPYWRLQWMLGGLTLVGIALAVLASIFTAKRIAQPLRQLADSAKRLGQGDYATPIGIKRDDEIGELANAFDIMRDGIAKRELEISRLAYWDILTNLPNRAQFVMLLGDAIGAASTAGDACFVLMMDLDRFKYVNDVLGHSVGDALLRQLAQRLQALLGDRQDTVARLGGDEFAILLPHSSLQQARSLAARVLLALESPLSVDDQNVDVGAGIGIAGFPAHGQDAESLLSLAEVAMYEAKQRNSGAVVYDSLIDKSSEQNLSLLSELRHASEHNEFRLYAQPKVLFGSGKVVGIEALVRWMHPVKGMVVPDSFIPFAEQTGFIRVLTRWVLEQSAALCQRLNARGIHLKISVNLSTRDLLDQDLPAKFADVLNHYQVDAAAFCLEITESAIMEDPIRAQQTLDRLHAMGVDLSIDDFGTGYSSLAYLKRLPVDELKIDKSFVLNMERDADGTTIVRSTIDLGHNMGLRVVAEGIESEAVWYLLADLGCDQGQGYFMSRPMPIEQLPDWLAGWQPPVLQTGLVH